MAIIINEEQSSGSGLMGIIVWIVILAVVGGAAYYIFFKNAEFVETITPSSFQNTAQLAQIRLNPDEVINNPKFQALRPYVTPVSPQRQGRQNPFLGL